MLSEDVTAKDTTVLTRHNKGKSSIYYYPPFLPPQPTVGQGSMDGERARGVLFDEARDFSLLQCTISSKDTIIIVFCY